MSGGRIMEGIITKEWTIWCEDCEEWDQECQASSQADAIRMWRKDGWQKRKRKWRCPDCSRKWGTPEESSLKRRRRLASVKKDLAVIKRKFNN